MTSHRCQHNLSTIKNGDKEHIRHYFLFSQKKNVADAQNYLRDVKIL